MTPIKNPTILFSYLRRAPFGGRLAQAQIDGINAILAEWQRRGLTDIRWLAYMLATAFHETGGRMQPVRENLNYTTAARIKETWPTRFPTIASAQPYIRNPRKLANKVYGGRMGNTGPDDGWIYRGDGLPQLTGKTNFDKFGVKPGMDLPTAIRVMFDGMIDGGFTGRKLSDYFNEESDAIGARAIVNGEDKAKLIAGYYKNFLDAIEAAGAAFTVADASPEQAAADDVKPLQSKSFISLVGGTLGTAGLSTLLGVDNAWGFGVAVLVLGIGAGAGYMFLSGRWSVNKVEGIA